MSRVSLSLLTLLALSPAGCGESRPPAAPAAALSEAPSPEQPPSVSAQPAPSPVDNPAPDGETLFDPDHDDPDDAPHPDRALGRKLEPDADQLRARGFVLSGVPDDVTVYVPRRVGPEWTYLIYDASMDHVGTIVEKKMSAAGPRQRVSQRHTTDIAVFHVWPSKFAQGQKKSGPGKRHSWSDGHHHYRIDVLVDLPWLWSGWESRAGR